jgi:hypothetical protein
MNCESGHSSFFSLKVVDELFPTSVHYINKRRRRRRLVLETIITITVGFPPHKTQKKREISCRRFFFWVFQQYSNNIVTLSGVYLAIYI